MDEKFLSFLADFFTNAARGQRSIQDMAQWVSGGLRGHEDLTARFMKLYGLEQRRPRANAENDTWKTAAAEFTRSFQEYQELMGVVPRQEHLKLVEKYEALKRTAAEQAETIGHLKMLLEDKAPGGSDLTRDFTRLMQKQTQQFQEAMAGMGRLFELDEKE